MELLFGEPDGCDAGRLQGPFVQSTDKRPDSCLPTILGVQSSEDATAGCGLDVERLWGALGGRLRTLRSLALVIHLKFGDLYSVSIRHSNPEESSSSPKLRHHFILATPKREAGSQEGSEARPIAIDPFFRDQFHLGLFDLEYSRFLDNYVPEVFVGSLPFMLSMLKVVCEMMHAALRRLDLGRPPWRQTAAVISRWFPSTYLDENVGPQFTGMLAAASNPKYCGQLRRSFLTETKAAHGNSAVGLATSRRMDHQGQVIKPCPKVVVMGFNVVSEQDGGARQVTPGGGLTPDCASTTEYPAASARSSGPSAPPLSPMVRSLSDTGLAHFTSLVQLHQFSAPKHSNP